LQNAKMAEDHVHVGDVIKFYTWKVSPLNYIHVSASTFST